MKLFEAVNLLENTNKTIRLSRPEFQLCALEYSSDGCFKWVSTKGEDVSTLRHLYADEYTLCLNDLNADDWEVIN